MSDNPTIQPIDDGPLMVHPAPSLRDADGTALEATERVALCRCGASSNKPFCDGSHRASGFTSANDEGEIRNTPQSYSGTVGGASVTVWYTPVLCSHAGECQRLASAVFDPKREPWVQPQGAEIGPLLKALSACPSGALRLGVEGDVTQAQHLTDGDVEIRIERHGPYHVRNVRLDAEFNGAGASRTKYVLCRCGHSRNKPFCDGTHYDLKWRDDG
ncbi:MAG: CDGSH iron-sulfur domain-containing protein [Pseudomonadota bacterium]